MLLDRQIEDSLEVYTEVERRTLEEANLIKESQPNESQQLRPSLYKNLKCQIKTTKRLIIKKKRIRAFNVFSGKVYCYLVFESFLWIAVSSSLTIVFAKIIELII